MSSKFTCPECPPNEHPCCQDTKAHCSQNKVENLPQNFTCLYEDLIKTKNQDAIRAVDAYSPDMSEYNYGVLYPGPGYVSSTLFNPDHNMFDVRFILPNTNTNTYQGVNSDILKSVINSHLAKVVNYTNTSEYNSKDFTILLHSTTIFSSALTEPIKGYLNRIKNGNLSSSDLSKKIEKALMVALVTGKYTTNMLTTIQNIPTSNSMSLGGVAPSYGLALSMANARRKSLYPKSTQSTYSQRERQMMQLIPSDINLKLKVYTADGCTARVRIHDDNTLPVYRDGSILSVNSHNEFLRVYPYFSDCRGDYMSTPTGCCFGGCYVALCSNREYAYALNAEDRAVVFKALGSDVKEPRMELTVEDTSVSFGMLAEFNYSLTAPLEEWYLLTPDLCGVGILGSTSSTDNKVKKTTIEYVKAVDAGTNPSNYNTIDPYVKRGGFGNIIYIDVDDPFWGAFNETSSVSVNIYDPNFDGRATEDGIYPRRIPQHLMLVPCNTTDMNPLGAKSKIVDMTYTSITRQLTVIPNPIMDVLDDTYITTEKYIIPGYVQGNDMFPIIKKSGISPGYFTAKAYVGGVQPVKLEHIVRKYFRLLYLISATYTMATLSYKLPKADLWKIMNFREFADFTFEFTSGVFNKVVDGTLIPPLSLVDVATSSVYTTAIDPTLSIIPGNQAVEELRIMSTIPRI